MLPQNPYITGNPVGNSQTFIGRADILQKMLNFVRHPQQHAIVLYGQRRIGKTSILKEFEAKLPQKGAYQPIFLDLQDKAQWSLKQILEELAQKISNKLNQTTPNLGDSYESFSNWLTKILNDLPSDTSLVLLFDEFDVLSYKSKRVDFFLSLYKLLNTHPKLKSIFVIGYTTRDLTNITLAFFENIETHKISLLNHDETVELICLSNNKDLNWSTDTIEKVWQLTNGHPYLTQCLCSHIWERLYEKVPNNSHTVSLKNIEDASLDTLNSSYHVLEWLWNGLPPAERMVASALANAGKPMTQIELERILGEANLQQRIIRELDNAPRLLQDWDIIEITENNSYQFRVELVRRWIVENKSFYQESEDSLNHDHKANTLYKQALELYDEQYLAEAVLLLKIAVESNPDHIRAIQLLSDILMEQNNYAEAVDILDKLHSIQPVAARLRLIQALLALAQFSDSEDKQFKYYERILEIDPSHPEAKNKLEQIRHQHQQEKYQTIKLFITRQIQAIKKFFLGR